MRKLSEEQTQLSNLTLKDFFNSMRASLVMTIYAEFQKNCSFERHSMVSSELESEGAVSPSQLDFFNLASVMIRELNTSLERFPANGYTIIYSDFMRLQEDYSIVSNNFPIILFNENYGEFFKFIVDTMNEPFFRQFNFFRLNEENQKEILDFFREYVSGDEDRINDIQRIRNKNRQTNDADTDAVYSYLLFEATMEYVRANLKERMKLIVSTFYDELPESKTALILKFDGILSEYEQITQVIKIRILPPFFIDYEKMKESCYQILLNFTDAYFQKMQRVEGLSETDINNHRKIKKLRTIIEGLNADTDTHQIAVIMRYILSQPFSGNSTSNEVLNHSVIHHFSRQNHPDNKFNVLSNMVSEKEWKVLDEMLSSNQVKQSSMIRMFSEKKGDSPPKQNRSGTQPPPSRMN